MKIGIMTLYYNNNNYGGLLQAYALQDFLQKQGHSAEQICWDFHKAIRDHYDCSTIRMSGTRIVVPLKECIVTKVTKKVLARLLRNRLTQRYVALKNFELEIPHSTKVFYPTNFHEIAGCYDCIIVGSDQIWNMSWYCPEHFLENCNDVIRVAYAASMPDINLTEIQKDTLQMHLGQFDAISVRERDTVDFLNSIMSCEDMVCWMPDPTLLLKKEDWEMICVPVEKISKPYIFCYFLGTGGKIRKAAQRMAKAMGIRLVTLPHLNDIVQADSFASGEKLYNIDPKQFLWLIKNASYVLTDSFHATVFSILFRTKFLTFGRDGNDEKNSRIRTLLSLFDMEDHLIRCDAALEQLVSIIKKDISNQECNLDQLRNKAKTFIDTSVNG